MLVMKELVCIFAGLSSANFPGMAGLPVLAMPGTKKYFTPVSVAHVPHVTLAEECLPISGLGMAKLIYTLKPKP